MSRYWEYPLWQGEHGFEDEENTGAASKEIAIAIAAAIMI
jgi:hypothetical protein